MLGYMLMILSSSVKAQRKKKSSNKPSLQLLMSKSTSWAQLIISLALRSTGNDIQMANSWSSYLNPPSSSTRHIVLLLKNSPPFQI
eukprot:CCRYP_003773-RA/>CCRYP_003773-RA protein AED:0.47 eAED:1.00 QI:0/-1/0/1/-1/0/1/0/85